MNKDLSDNVFPDYKKEVELLKGQIEMWKIYEYKARMETLALLDENTKLREFMKNYPVYFGTKG